MAGVLAAGRSVTDCGVDVVTIGTVWGSVGEAITEVVFGVIAGHGAKAQPY